MSSRVVGIVLAAGASLRMGRLKQLLPFGPTTLLGHAIAQAEASALDAVVVVTGRPDRVIRESIEVDRAEWAHNRRPHLGTVETLRVGIDAAGDADAYVVLAADTPGVGTDLIDRMVRLARAGATGPTRTVYAGEEWGQPFLLPRVAASRLPGLSGDKALVSLLTGELDARHRRKPIDVNTWDDYLAACGEFGYEPASSGSAPTA